MAEIEKKLPFDPSFGWAGKFDFDENEDRNFDLGDDLFGGHGSNNRPAEHPSQLGLSAEGQGGFGGQHGGYGGQAGQGGQEGYGDQEGFDRNALSGAPGIDQYQGMWKQIAYCCRFPISLCEFVSPPHTIYI